VARALTWIREARSGPDGVGRVVEALRASEDEAEARLMGLALARAGALDALGDVLATGSDTARDAALEALGTASGEVGAVALAAAATQAHPWRTRRLVALAAQKGADVGALWDPDRPAVAAVVLQSLPSPVPAGWRDRLESACEAEDSEVAWVAVVRLAAESDLGAAGVLEDACAHASPFVRAQAARGLVALGLTPAVDVPGLWRDDIPLVLDRVRALDDSAPDDVERAALALGLAVATDALLAAVGRLAASELAVATDALVDGTDHPLPSVRAACVRALDGRTGEAVWGAYDRRVHHDPDPAQRTGAVWTVSRRRELDALPWIVRWAQATEPAVRRAAVEGLAVRVRRTARSRTRDVYDALMKARQEPDLQPIAEEALARFPKP